MLEQDFHEKASNSETFHIENFNSQQDVDVHSKEIHVQAPQNFGPLETQCHDGEAPMQLQHPGISKVIAIVPCTTSVLISVKASSFPPLSSRFSIAFFV